MYQIQSAYGVTRAQGAVWAAQDIGQLTGMQLFTVFRRLFITLKTPLLQQPVSIDIADYEALLSFDTRTATEIFDEWTDPTPLKAVTVPNYRTARAVFTDAFRAGYEIHKSIPGAHFTSSKDVNLKTEMQLTRIGVDMQRFAKYCLVTSNGFFYRVEADRDMAYVAEAGKSLLRTNRNHVGILSFENVGEIATYPIDKTKVMSQALSGKLWDGINVPLPDVDLTGKTLMLVIGGYLQLEADGVFSKVGTGRAVIHPQAMYLFERYQESYQYVDWNPIVGDNGNKDYVNIDVLTSDAAMTALVAHPQTFWVVLNTPNLVKNRVMIRGLPMPGNFITAKEPKSLLVAGTGYVLEYWKRYEDGEWAVNCSGVMPGVSVVGTLGRDDLKANVSMRNLPYAVVTNIQAFLMDLIADEIAA